MKAEKGSGDDLPPELCRAALSVNGNCADMEKFEVTTSELQVSIRSYGFEL